MATNHEKALRDDVDMVSGGTVKFRMERHPESLLAEKDAEIARLRSALKPFADFAKEYGPVASTLDYPEDHPILEVGTENGPAVVRLQDFYAASAALGEDK